MKNPSIRFITSLTIPLLLSACSLLEINKQAELIDGAGRIHGQVENKQSDQGPIYAILFTMNEHEIVERQTQLLDEGGSFHMDMLPGEYHLGAFVDTNNDGEYQQGEPGTYIGIDENKVSTITVQKNAQLTAPTLIIRGPIKPIKTEQRKIAEERSYDNIGRKTGLDNPIFSRDYAEMGLWRPTDFAAKGAVGLYTFSDYSENKTPIVFVHGINGTPLDWKPTIEKLDTENYQAWALYYPSGMPLDIVSDYLYNALNIMQERHNYKQLYIFAHSMGGLVTRSLIKKNSAKPAPLPVEFVLTLNSPLHGMPSAGKGVKYSPIVVPSWRDVAAGSDFIVDLHQWSWPKDLNYTLVFSWQKGRGDDGVVALESQLTTKLQQEARQIHGLNASHAGALSTPEFLELVDRKLIDLQTKQ
ncbi:lipase family alpha/beta hydrolase [Agaribacterium sp. ZY112]|uniref:lipase family alpha/beta hydrolase n=1 Tax=Agaribacterium sp. ZY112 TaxID=3233574 RepID=UPI003523773E